MAEPAGPLRPASRGDDQRSHDRTRDHADCGLSDRRINAVGSRVGRWYDGSGATPKTGTVFGYAGRLSHGHTGLGTVTEGALDYRFNPRWSVNAYLGASLSGDVVTSNFTASGRPLVFGYVEHVLQF